MKGSMPQPLQLDLFSWDTLAVGEGYECLARFDFPAATAHFFRVTGSFPNHAGTGGGLEAVNYWQAVFLELAGLEEAEVFCFLWKSINHYPFTASGNHKQLRQALLRHLLQLMDGKDTFYVPPDLCTGYLHLQLGDLRAAERCLRTLLERLPENGRLWGYLADALYAQERSGRPACFT